MALPQVGVEAVVANLSSFEAGGKVIASTYDNLIKKAEDVEKSTSQMGLRFDEAAGRWRTSTGQFASGAQMAAAGVENVKKSVDNAGGSIISLGGIVGKLSSSISSLIPNFVTIGQAVLKFGAIAGGAALLGVGALTAGVVALGASALGEFSKFERMSLSIQNLVAREISQGQIVEQQRQTRIALTKKEAEELANLPQKIKDEELSRNTLTAQIQEQRQKIIDLTASYGENGLNVQTAKGRLAEMENELAKSGGEIDKMNKRVGELNAKNGQLTTVLQKVRVGQISMTEAMTQAGPRAAELLKWIQLLAVQSPFTQEGVQIAFQTALTYGFTTEQSQRLTQAMIDFTSATGKSEAVMNDVAYALGQIQARGKVTAHEMRMLGTAGIGVNRILEDMGFTLDDVTAGNVPFDKFIEAVTKDMEVFSGAAKRQATTFSGLFSTFSDIKDIGLREFFTGTFQAIQPYLANFANTLTDMIFTTGSIRTMGDALGTFVGGGLKTITDLVTQFQRWGPEGIFAAMGFRSSGLFFASLQALFDLISGNLPSAESMFASFGGVITWLQQNAFPMLTQAVSFVIQNFDSFKGALLGIGAVLGAGIFAAIVAGILALLTPINLIIAGAALLGAAWVGNWGGIQEKTAAVWAVVQPILAQIGTWLMTNIPLAIQVTSDFWTNTLMPAMITAGIFIQTNIIPVLAQLGAWLQTNIPMAVQALTNAWNGILLPALTTGGNFITTVIVPNLTLLWQWLQANIPAALATLANFWTGTLLPAITAVNNYLNSTVFPLFYAISNFLAAVFVKTLQALAGVWQNLLLPALRIAADVIGRSLQPAFAAVGSTVDESVMPTLNKLGESILPVLKKGLDLVTDAIKKATDFFNGLANAVKKFELPDVLKPGSPPPMAIALRDVADSALLASKNIGDFVNNLSGVNTASGAFLNKLNTQVLQASGLGEFLGGGFLPQHQIQKAFKKILGSIAATGGAVTGAGLQQQIANVLSAAGKPAAAVLAYLKEHTAIDFDAIAQQIGDSFSEINKTMRIENLSQTMGTASQFLSFGQAAVDRLKNRVDLLQAIVDTGQGGFYQGQIISAIDAQDKLNQALAEQASVQKEILDMQRQQADLQFLQQQLSLIKMINDMGLDARDILGNITFGLDASLPDLIKATNNVVSAVVNQINGDITSLTSTGQAIGNAITSGVTQTLQIASDSKVMAKLGAYTTGGFIKGMMSQVPNLMAGVSQAITGPAIVSAPALAGAGGNNITMYNDFGGNTISGQMDQATFDAMVLRSLQRLM